jgi:HrpA-like RNA helicase
VVYVVDSGRVKISQFKAGEQTSSLKSVNASLSSLKQV